MGFPYTSVAASRVVVTTKPLHSLAANITAGVSEPYLLLKGSASPHAYALRPSDSAALSDATVVVRTSPGLEVFLARALAALPSTVTLLDASKAPGLTLLPVRESGSFEPHSHAVDHDGDDHDHSHSAEDSDPHFWLDPQNAALISSYIAGELARIDPANATAYLDNLANLKLRLAALDLELRGKFRRIKGKPFILFHDVMQYLDQRYELNAVGAVTVSPERQPGAKRLALIRTKIEASGAICVFSEPQFTPKLISTLTIGTKARHGTLDEVGSDTPEGRDHYFIFMNKNADSLVSCLSE